MPFQNIWWLVDATWKLFISNSLMPTIQKNVSFLRELHSLDYFPRWFLKWREWMKSKEWMCQAKNPIPRVVTDQINRVQCMVNLFWENVTLSIYTVKNYRSTQNGILIFSKHFSSWESSITDHRFWVRVLRPHSRFLQLRNCGQVTSLYLSFLIYKMYFLHKAVIGINCTSICDVFKGSGRQPEHLSVVWYRDLKCLCKKFI